MKKLIVANWKLNPTTESEAKKLAKVSDVSFVIILPPFPYIISIKENIKNAELGAQDVFWEEEGAFTGEVSSTQLKNIGVSYILAGHSERREKLGETDSEINKKINAALKAGMKIILCVGEDIETRKEGINEAKKFITEQIKLGLKGVSKKDLKNIIIAYEPVWAIGSGTPDIPEETAEIADYIKNLIQVRTVLYGGSVNSKNAKEFLGQDSIDGALVGGASLSPKEFIKVLEEA